MATAALLGCLLFTILAAVQGSKCPPIDVPSKQIVCYYEGTVDIDQVNLCNCTHLIFSNAVTIDGFNLTVDSNQKINEKTALDAKDLRLVFTVNFKPEDAAAVLKSEEKKISVLNGISSLLTASEFSGVEINFDFNGSDGTKKEDVTSFMKDLRGLVSHHRVKRDGYSVFEEDQNDFTTGRYTTEKYGSIKSSTPKKRLVKKKKSRIPRDDKNVDFYDDDEAEFEAAEDEDSGVSELLKRTRRKQRVDEQGELKDEHESHNDDYLIMLRLSVTPEVIAKKYDLKTLVKYVDYLMVPTHLITDESEEHLTYHPSRLMGYSDMLNTDSILDLLTGLGAPKEKLIVSMPADVFQHELKDATQNTVRSNTVGEAKRISQAKMCSLLKSGNWTVERDEDLTAPYAFSKTKWLAFEDETSVNIKAKYIILRDLAGGAIFPIDSDNFGESCTVKEAGRMAAGLQKNFGGLARKPRQAILASLQEQIHDTATFSQEAGVHLSEYRIVRVVDHSGAVHVIRKNTKTEFECSRQGYFSHPLGCNKFYRCVKFNQYTEDYTVFEYDCPAGLAFDERWEVCVWPGSLPNGAPCTGSSEIAPVPRAVYQCPNVEGYYADPENCRWFFACLDHSRDGISPLTAYEFRCPFGLVFDENTLVCDWPWKVGGCGARGLAGTVLTRVDGASSYRGNAQFINGGRASFATVPDYVISGGRIANKAGGVVLNQNIVGGLTGPLGINVASGFGEADKVSAGTFVTPTHPSSFLVEDGGSRHRSNGGAFVSVAPSSILAEDGGASHLSQGATFLSSVTPSTLLVDDGGASHRSQGAAFVSSVTPSTFLVDDGGSSHRSQGGAFVSVTPSSIITEDGGASHRSHGAAILSSVTPSSLLVDDGGASHRSQGAAFVSSVTPSTFLVDNGGASHRSQGAAFISTATPASILVNSVKQGAYLANPTPSVLLDNSNRAGLGVVPIAKSYATQDIYAGSVPSVIAGSSYGTQGAVGVSIKPTFLQEVYGQRISSGEGYRYDKPSVAFNLPTKNTFEIREHVSVTPRPISYAQNIVPVTNVNPVVYEQKIAVTPAPVAYSQVILEQQKSIPVYKQKPIVVQSYQTPQPVIYKQDVQTYSTPRPIVYQQPAVSLKPVFYQKEIASPAPIVLQKVIHTTQRPIVYQQEIVTPSPIIYKQDVTPIATPKPVVYQQIVQEVPQPQTIVYGAKQKVQPISYQQEIVQPVVYQQQVVTPRPLVQKIVQVTPKPVVYQQQPVVYQQEIVAPKPVVYQQQYVAPKPVVYQQQIVTPKPVVYEQQYVTPKPVLYQQQYVTPKPVVYQQQYVTPKPVVYQQEIVTPKPVIYEQQYVTPKPLVYQQVVTSRPPTTPKSLIYQQVFQVSQPISPKPVVYEQQYVTPKPVVYQQEIVTPKPVVYQQQYVTPKPVVYQQEIVTPKPVVYQQQYVTPKPVVYQQEIVTPKPVVYQQQYVTPKPVVYQQEIVTPKPVVYQQEIVTPKPVVYQQQYVTPKPVAYQQEIVTPKQVVYQQQYVTPKPVVYQQEIVTPKPVVYQQQYVTPKPVVYQQQYVTPKPVVYQQEIVTPKPVVYQQEIVTPKPVVYQQQYVTPKSVVYQQEIVTPKPVVYQQQYVTPKPVVYQQKIVTLKPVVYQQQYVTPKPVVYQQEIVTPKPVVYQQEVVTPKSVVYQQKIRPVVYQQEIEQPVLIQPRPFKKVRPVSYVSPISVEQTYTTARPIVVQEFTPKVISTYQQPELYQQEILRVKTRPVTYVQTEKPTFIQTVTKVTPKITYQQEYRPVSVYQTPQISKIQTTAKTVYAESYERVTPGVSVIQKEYVSTDAPILVQHVRQKGPEYLPPLDVTLAPVAVSGINSNIEIAPPPEGYVLNAPTTSAPVTSTLYASRTRLRVRPTTTEASREYLPPVEPTKRTRGRGKTTIVSIGQVDKAEVDDQNLDGVLNKYSGKLGPITDEERDRFVTKIIKGDAKGNIKLGREPEVSTVGYEITSQRGRSRSRTGARKQSSSTTTTEEYESGTDSEDDVNNGDISLATLDLKNLKLKKDKKTVIVVSQVSDANPLLIGKLASTCSCESNNVNIRSRSRRPNGRKSSSDDDGENPDGNDGDNRGGNNSYQDENGVPSRRTGDSLNRSQPDEDSPGNAGNSPNSKSGRGRRPNNSENGSRTRGRPASGKSINIGNGDNDRPSNDNVENNNPVYNGALFGNKETDADIENSPPVIIGDAPRKTSRGRRPSYTDSVVTDAPRGQYNVEIINDDGVPVVVTSTTTILPEVSPSILVPLEPGRSRVRTTTEAVLLPVKPAGRRIPSRSKARVPFIQETSPLFSPITADEIASTIDYQNVLPKSRNSADSGSSGEQAKVRAGAAFDRYGPGGWRGADETLQGSVDCKRPGLFRHPKYCNKFYSCNYDSWKKRYTLSVFNCPVHLAYDDAIGACNWPSKGPACVDDNLIV